MTLDTPERAAHRLALLKIYLLENAKALRLRVGSHNALADHLATNVGVARDSLGGFCITQAGHQGRDVLDYVADALAGKKACERFFVTAEPQPVVTTDFANATAKLDHANGVGPARL